LEALGQESLVHFARVWMLEDFGELHFQRMALIGERENGPHLVCAVLGVLEIVSGLDNGGCLSRCLHIWGSQTDFTIPKM
jgi:hypothetical protein